MEPLCAFGSRQQGILSQSQVFGFLKPSVNTLHSALGVLLVLVFVVWKVGELENLFAGAFTL